MSGSTPTRWQSSNDQNSLTPHPAFSFNIPHSHNDPDGHAGNPVHPGVDTAGRQRHPALSTVARFSLHPHHTTIPDHVVAPPEQFDDTPYVPPRITQAEQQIYSALDPRLGSVYGPANHDIQHRNPYEGGTSPSDSQHSIESSWSNSSSSSASSHRLPQDYFIEPTYSHAPLPPRQYPQHYPAYHGHQRLGLEHVRYGLEAPHTGGSYYRIPPQGYSLEGLLSPEVFDDTTAQVATPSQPQNISTFSASPAPLINSTGSVLDAGDYLRQQLGLLPHQPVGLHSLADPAPGEKPSTPLPMLIKLAIYGSPNKQLTLQEIYTELENRFQWFREHKNDRAWKNSIRHNLSLNKVFKHAPRPITEPGKGSYWQLDVSEGEGYKRTRKRRRKNKIVISEEEDEEGSSVEENQHAGPSQSSAMSLEDAQIDPELRSEGHVVGECRIRSTNRRSDRESPYPQQSPRYQQGTLPMAVGQEANAPGQPSIRFGSSSFPTYPQTRLVPASSSSSLIAAISSTSTAVRPQLKHMVSGDHTAQPSSRSGIEYVGDEESLAVTESPGQSQRDISPESSSSGSSRTWNNARSSC